MSFKSDKEAKEFIFRKTNEKDKMKIIKELQLGNEYKIWLMINDKKEKLTIDKIRMIKDLFK